MPETFLCQIAVNDEAFAYMIMGHGEWVYRRLEFAMYTPREKNKCQ